MLMTSQIYFAFKFAFSNIISYFCNELKIFHELFFVKYFLLVVIAHGSEKKLVCT